MLPHSTNFNKNPYNKVVFLNLSLFYLQSVVHPPLISITSGLNPTNYPLTSLFLSILCSTTMKHLISRPMCFCVLINNRTKRRTCILIVPETIQKPKDWSFFFFFSKDKSQCSVRSIDRDRRTTFVDFYVRFSKKKLEDLS